MKRTLLALVTPTVVRSATTTRLKRRWPWVLGYLLLAVSPALRAQDNEANANAMPPPAEQTGVADPTAALAPEEDALDGRAGAMSGAGDGSSGSGGLEALAGAGGGRFNFQTELATGQLAYSVPLRVAPARQGAVPTLALNYKSGVGNGWCGVGWSLEVGFIQREIRYGVPIKWSPSAPAPLNEYDDAKSFIANIGGAGSRLILVSATNVNPLLYQQEVETAFLTYKYFNDNHWEVVDKSGNTFYFGEGATNRMENTKSGWTAGAGQSTFRWALNRVLDINGNQTTLSYTSDSGMLYLTNIAYNANVNSPALAASHTVEFILTNRSDKSITFQSGYRIETAKLLSEVRVKAGGANVRKYVLGYQSSPSTLRSLLKSITEYGSDFTTALPAVAFAYQAKPFEFETTNKFWTFPASADTGGNIRPSESLVDYDLLDLDGDGFADRVARRIELESIGYCPTTGEDLYNELYSWAYQPNSANGFQSELTYAWPNMTGCPTNLVVCTYRSREWSPFRSSISSVGTAALLDMNRDGLLDRLIRSPYSGYNYSNFYVELNSGQSLCSRATWPGVSNNGLSNAWAAPKFTILSGSGNVNQSVAVDLFDLNGDGLPDRVMRKGNSPYTNFVIQFNTGSGFAPTNIWGPVSGLGSAESNSITATTTDTSPAGSHTYTMMRDLNGDGLPDRVMLRIYGSPYTNFVVQFNNGAGFEPIENWGPVDTQGNNSSLIWGSPGGTLGEGVVTSLVDINADGLPDRVMRKVNSPYTNLVVQLNTGSGFASAVQWGPLKGTSTTSANWNSVTATETASPWRTYVDLLDINADGLPDRVMRDPTSSAYTNFLVQLNKGPFPDLLNTVSNGIGGTLFVSYVPSTAWDNRHTNWVNNPWTEHARCLLPFPIHTVSQIGVADGLGDTKYINYTYKGGFFDGTRREFRGFAITEVTDPLGARTRTYFHQSGGRDDTAYGEYQDQNSIAKKGIPYRVDVIGSDTNYYRVTLNKVEEVQVHTNGVYFPFISQTINLTYEGLGNYRATAKQLAYDSTTGNLLMDASLGEVTNVVFSTHEFTDLGSDSLFTHTAYASFANPDILNKPASLKITSDSAGNNRLRETTFSYDARGNLTTNRVWLDTAGDFITTGSLVYDQYGNPTASADAAGITTATYYDSTYRQYPVTQVTGTFTNQTVFDIRSGAAISATDAKGLVASNYFDAFFRPVVSYISTNAYGAPTLWRTKIDYNLGGIQSSLSYNYVRKRVYDDVDLTNGHESYGYFDGLGRTVQARIEAENGQYRVADTLYDERGSPNFQTMPRFSAGAGFTILTGTNLGSLTEYDAIGRAWRVTPAVQAVYDGSGNFQTIYLTDGDTGSPAGAITNVFRDGNDPWASVAADAENKLRKSYADAYGRVVRITEVLSTTNYQTTYTYDLLGNLTNVTDHAGNATRLAYDSLGRKTSMTDPDMGAWSYVYDNAGRLTEQTDARTNTIKFYFNDALGRLTTKEVYNAAEALVATSTYTYDTSDDPAYTVYKGQLYRVTDSQGWQKNSYDVRSRVLKSGRNLSAIATTYVSQSSYDEADRVKEISYPASTTTKIRYDYDTAGNLTNVISTAGTGAQAERFYRPLGFNELGQPYGVAFGNGVISSNLYYANSKRVKQLLTSIGGTNHQNLAYTFDKESNLKSIADGVWTSGSTSASITNLVYDDLHRLVSLYSTAFGATRAFAYSPIGNMLTNGEAVGGTGYAYGTKPHAATSAFGRSYAYDACGNMTSRGVSGGTQTLEYDEENRLTRVSGAGGSTVTFGYADVGERLWRYNGSSYAIWIGGIYEERNSKQLCHVFAGGRRVATFEPQAGSYAATSSGKDNFVVARQKLERAVTWPFRAGRGAFALVLGTLLGMLAVCLAARRQLAATPELARRRVRARPLWQGAVSLVTIIALILATTETRVEAATYSPVFYYYHPDHLGSTTVLTDRAGERVDHHASTAFGREQFNESTPAFEMSNRFTGQIFDDETGLYYYGARYYDPELGRFIQPDTVVASSADAQALNRYTYCGNNPLKYVDPSGHFSFLVGIIIGAAIGGATAAATGGDIGLGILTGAIGGLFGGLGSWAGGAIGGSTGAFIGAVAGGAAGGAVSAAITGGDIGMGALTGAIAGGIGFGVGKLTQGMIRGWHLENTGWAELIELGGASIGGAIGGGIGAELQGGDFWGGAAYGAAGAAIGYGVGYFLKWNNGRLEPGDRNIGHHAAQLLGKLWNVPNTVLGLVLGFAGWTSKSQITFGHNSVIFTNNRFFPTSTVNGKTYASAMTLGNVMVLGGNVSDYSAQVPIGQVPIWLHEMQHTYQGQQLGPAYTASNILGLTVGVLAGDSHGPWSWNERGPESNPPRPWK